MVNEGGHSNYNAGNKRSVTFPVDKMPFELQKTVLSEVLSLYRVNNNKKPY